MYLHALATAVPATSFTQADCWELAQRSEVRNRLNRRSMLTLQAVLRGDTGLKTRHFAVPDIENVYDLSPDQLNESFRAEAPKLAGRALASALAQADLRADQLDALLICTCTGYLCPGVTSYVAEQLGVRSDAFLQDLVGLGCGASIPTLRSAQGVLAARPDAIVACVAVEICSAAFYLDNDPGVLISACLFSDGAAATIWRTTPGPRGFRVHSFSTAHYPADRDRIRFEQREGKLRNLLDATVPKLAARAVSRLFSTERTRPAERPVSQIISHAGGRDVIDAIEAAVPGYPLGPTRTVLRDFGNMSSPSVLFTLEEGLRHSVPDTSGDWWLVSFGAGFSVHGCRLGV